MIYFVIAFTLLSVWAAGYAITAPHSIQRMLMLADREDSPESILQALTKSEQMYLLTSSVPLILVPLLFFSEIERSSIYAGILIVLALVGFFFKEKYSQYGIVIRIGAVLELILYSDIIRNGLVTLL